MGLSISVGLLADLLKNDMEGVEWLTKEFQQVNEVLREYNLPEHHEPVSSIYKDESCGFPCSWLHYLRRVAAYRFRDENWIAEDFPANEDPTKDVVLDSELFMMDSHLLCHSDCEGFYVPINFKDVIFDDPKKNRISGGMLGSSYRLMEELVQIAPALEIKLVDGTLSDDEADKIYDLGKGDKLFREKTVWLELFEAARISIEHKTAIVFH